MNSNFIKTMLVLLALLGLALGVSAKEGEKEAPKEKVFSGTVEINSTQFALIVSGQSGSGVLKYQGEEYPFIIGGLGVGGVGIAKMNAVGEVYNLKDLSEFSGTYVQVRAGATLGKKGSSVLRLGNSSGVEMHLKSSNEGIALQLGADGMNVKLKE